MYTIVVELGKDYKVSFPALTLIINVYLYLYKHGTKSKTAAGVYFM